MADLEAVIETYATRLAMPECYTETSEALSSFLEYDLRRFGLHPFDRIAHGVLAFCIDGDRSMCVPWLVSPEAPYRDAIGGRHSFVAHEFYDIAEGVGFQSYTKGVSWEVSADDLIGTYIIRDPKNETLFTAICDSTDTGLTSPDQIELIKDLSRLLSDHRIVIDVGEGSDSVCSSIKSGDAKEIPYGQQRGMRLPTIAEPGDVIGKARELESYASFAEKHGLSNSEFMTLTERAVSAFHDGRQIGLDALCLEIIAER